MAYYSLFQIFHDLDPVHTRHSIDWNEAENDFALRVRANPGERPIQMPPLAAGLLEDIEIPQESYAVTIHVKYTAAKPPNSSIVGP